MPTPRQTPAEAPALSSYLALLIGLFLVVALIKWGNPVVLEPRSSMPAPTGMQALMPTGAPDGALDLIYGPWPIRWAYWGIIPVAALGLAVFVRSLRNVSQKGLRWMLLPLGWLLWQFLTASQTSAAELTAVTLPQFVVCVGFFYLGVFGHCHRENSRIIWVCLTMGLFCVLRAGFDQHFGGLEATRRMVHKLPNWESLPPLFLKRLDGNRIFATLFYPNSLAGVILLLTPIAVCFVWLSAARFSKVMRWVLALAVAAAPLAALYWSGSKAGWLLVVVVGMVGLWHSPVNLRWKRWLTAGILVLALTGFVLKNAGYLQKGATSVVARFDYWRAAVHIFAEHPILGTGPGTFGSEYLKIKSRESEMAWVTHNDYLEQASDSGVVGAIVYIGFWVLALAAGHRHNRKRLDLMAFAVWLGLLGYAMHSFVELHLYIPALAWPAFFLLGWSWSNASVTEMPERRVSSV